MQITLDIIADAVVIGVGAGADEAPRINGDLTRDDILEA
jgi:hypothetical protein